MSEQHGAEKDPTCPGCQKRPCVCATVVLPTTEKDAAPSYHDLHITTANLPRTSIFDLPYDYEVSCTRVGGWTVWLNGERVGGEYDEGLRLDVAGHVICDSLTRPLPPGSGRA